MVNYIIILLIVGALVSRCDSIGNSVRVDVVLYWSSNNKIRKNARGTHFCTILCHNSSYGEF